MPSHRPDCFQISAGWITGIVISCPPIAFISSRMIVLTLSITRWPSGSQTNTPAASWRTRPGAEHELVAEGLGVRGVFAKGGQQRAGDAHAP